MPSIATASVIGVVLLAFDMDLSRLGQSVFFGHHRAGFRERHWAIVAFQRTVCRMCFGCRACVF